MFLPLAGKSLDMLWLCEQGMTVVGNDTREKTAVDFFQENSIPFKKCKCIHRSVTRQYPCRLFHFLVPTTTTTGTQGAFIVYEATDRKIKFLVGNIFNCTPEVAGVFDCIWEASSLIAHIPKYREKYV